MRAYSTAGRRIDRQCLARQQFLVAILLRHLHRDAVYMQEPERSIVIGGQPPVQRIVGMGTYQNVVRLKAGNDQRVVVDAFLVGKLDEITRRRVRDGYIPSERTCSAVRFPERRSLKSDTIEVC